MKNIQYAIFHATSFHVQTITAYSHGGSNDWRVSRVCGVVRDSRLLLCAIVWRKL